MPKVDIDTAYIENLAELLARTGLTEIEICQGDARIRVAKQVATSVEYVQGGHLMAPAAPAPAMAAAAAEPVADSAPHPTRAHGLLQHKPQPAVTSMRLVYSGWRTRR